MFESENVEQRRTFFKLDNALRVALRSESRRQAILYFCRLLREAALTYRSGVHYTRSIGLTWLSNNHEQFHELLPDATPFFCSFLTEEPCAVQIIHDQHLLELIAPQNRAGFIKDVIVRYSPDSLTWLFTVRKMELPVGALASVLSDTIQIVTSRRDPVRNYLVEVFLRDGMSDTGWMWQTLNAEQFYQAVCACASVNVGALFAEADRLLPRIAERVTAQQYEEILGYAGMGVSDLRYVRLESIKMFPAEAQLRAVACSTELPLDIMEHVATLPGGPEAIAEYQQYVRQVHDVEVAQKMAQTATADPDSMRELLGSSQRVENVSVKLPVL